MKKLGNHKVWLLLAVLMGCLFLGGMKTEDTFAAWGTGDGGTNRYCSSGGWFCTTFGATWRWYWTDQDEVYIPNDYGKEYTQATTIRGCKNLGYWRYAMVSSNDGRQSGVIGLTNNAGGWSFNSEFFGGGMHYRGPNEWAGGEDWNKVYRIHENMKARGYNVGEWGGNLAWFCGGADETPQNTLHVNTIFVEETITTDCTGASRTETKELPVEYKTYTSNDNRITGIDTLRDDRAGQGWTVLWWAPDGNKDGITWHGDVVDADFSDTVHERIVTIKLQKQTKVFDNSKFAECIKDTDCKAWAPTTYISSDQWQGNTEVRIGVINHTLENYNDNGKWHHELAAQNELMQGPVYAKPTDKVQWKYCYYPGVETTADGTVTVNNNHPEPSRMSPTTNTLDNKAFHAAYGEGAWKGKFNAWTERLKENEDVTCPGGTKGTGDPNAVTGTLPGCESGGSNSVYAVQPRDQLTYYKSESFANKLDPGDTLWGYIRTTSGFTHVDRSEEDVHHWTCNVTPCGTEEEPNRTCSETCQHNDKYYPNNKSSAEKNDSAQVIVPYNYKNSAHASIDKAGNYIYAGESVGVESPTVTVGVRRNPVTSPDIEEGYATQVDSGRARLVAFLMDSTSAESENYFNGVTYREDAYGNQVDEGDDGVIWRDPREVCGLNGQNNAFNAKNGVCKYLEQYDPSDGPLNENSNITGVSYNFGNGLHTEPGNEETTSPTYNVFDEAAGDYFCVAAAVYPFSVTSNTETNEQGDQSWYISKPSCKQLAKRPTFQVWGAGMYSAGGIKTNQVTAKTNVLDENGYIDTSNYRNMQNIYWGFNWEPKSSAKKVQFGSWGELGVTSGGTVENFGSGASTGYNGMQYDNNDVNFTSPWKKVLADASWNSSSMVVGKGMPGGDTAETAFCLRSPLTIANSNCSIGGFSESNMHTSLSSDIIALTNMFPVGSAERPGDSATVGGEVLYPGETRVNIWNGDITVTNDITYATTSGYSTIMDVPKYIIYASGNINIQCNVKRIDAVLLAGKTINTCSDGGDDTWDGNRSTQLVINGAMVGNQIVLPRTYGAGMGRYSMVPAELVNYDSSLYLWANRQAEAATSGQMSETTIRELAPRY